MKSHADKLNQPSRADIHLAQKFILAMCQNGWRGRIDLEENMTHALLSEKVANPPSSAEWRKGMARRMKGKEGAIAIALAELKEKGMLRFNGKRYDLSEAAIADPTIISDYVASLDAAGRSIV